MRYLVYLVFIGILQGCNNDELIIEATQAVKHAMEDDIEDVAKLAFKKLININDVGRDEFLNDFKNFEELVSLSTDIELVQSEDIVRRSENLDLEKANQSMINSYNKIIQRAARYHISWDQAKYSGFEYDSKIHGELTHYTCKLYILCNSNSYSINFSAFKYKGDIKLIGFHKLREVSPQ